MAKVCDHTSVGILAWKDERLLLIERARFPFGFAIPAGHVDGEGSFEEAAIRELKEETGLDAHNLKLVIEGKREMPCRREDGTWHYWKIYQAEVSGAVLGSEDETREAGWYSKEQISKLAQRTLEHRNKNISEEEWEKNPGLEEIMYDWFTELKII